MIFVIFLHTLKVSSVSISAAACKRSYQRPQNRVKVSQKFADSLKSTFFKIHTQLTDFDELCRISTCILQMSHSQIDAGSAQIWIYFIFMFSKNFKRDFLKSTFFKLRTLYACFSSPIEQYALYSSETCWYGCLLPNFVKNFRIHFSDVGNIFLERITYASVQTFKKTRVSFRTLERCENIFWRTQHVTVDAVTDDNERWTNAVTPAAATPLARVRRRYAKQPSKNDYGKNLTHGNFHPNPTFRCFHIQKKKQLKN